MASIYGRGRSLNKIFYNLNLIIVISMATRLTDRKVLFHKTGAKAMSLHKKRIFSERMFSVKIDISRNRNDE
jgi:hypothetical protein